MDRISRQICFFYNCLISGSGPNHRFVHFKSKRTLPNTFKNGLKENACGIYNLLLQRQERVFQIVRNTEETCLKLLMYFTCLWTIKMIRFLQKNKDVRNQMECWCLYFLDSRKNIVFALFFFNKKYVFLMS